jgi:hypothetical protein
MLTPQTPLPEYSTQTLPQSTSPGAEDAWLWHHPPIYTVSRFSWIRVMRGLTVADYSANRTFSAGRALPIPTPVYPIDQSVSVRVLDLLFDTSAERDAPRSWPCSSTSRSGLDGSYRLLLDSFDFVTSETLGWGSRRPAVSIAYIPIMWLGS